MNENTETNPEYPEYIMPAGAKSLLALFVFVITFIPVAIWSSQPQYQGPGGLGVGMMMGTLTMFFWLPLFVTALVLAIISIKNNNGRKQGIITLSSIAVLVLWETVSVILN